MDTKIIAIIGASGSGKTTLANQLAAIAKDKGYSSVIISQDDFYLPSNEPVVNYDLPKAIDFELLIYVLEQLKVGIETPIPCYDFTSHQRKTQTLLVEPANIIIVEGLFLLCNSALAQLFTSSLALEIDDETCFQRRLKRDQQERGRDADEIHHQYLTQVKPGYEAFIKPSFLKATHCIKSTPKNIETLFNQLFLINGTNNAFQEP